ncbi:SDR family oxidoreductase [Photobacterium sp. BZF1]|uniref:SDR family NAD(P)-dependent oxidoreductase n=1 Tax=Photobacterium sp. BZF1 TaxID=1904457 RepID=UPI001653E932|nr:SDR family oxidoreductase [Photobacterium sp. BZF1]MBC7003020.1 SDR family oxidoreductase [Photobacterium sp. BZF1]
MSEFKNKVVVISGAASGIGAETSKLYAELGAHVIGVDLAPAQETVTEIELQGGSAQYFVGDVSVEDTWQKVAVLAQEKGGADILVNIAGYSVLEDNAETLTSELWQKIMGINLKGHWMAAKHLLSGMKQKGGGAIINMSSATSLVGVPNHAAYSMSKGGVDALTRQLAVEYAQDNIRVNAVCPGPVRTPMISTNSDEMMEQIVNAVPLKRIAEPREIAEIIAFLSSSAASSITGTVLPIDGGLSMAM